MSAANDRVIPNESTHEVVVYEVLVEGNLIDPSFQVISIDIQLEVNRLASAKIVLRDGEPAISNFELSEKEDFIPGKKIKINVGYDSDRRSLFEGVIVRHAIRANKSGHSTLTIECKHEAVKMTLGRKSKYFVDSLDSDVIEEILGEYSLADTVEATTVMHKEIVQHYITDWDFVLLRAEMNGQLVFPEGAKINVNEPITEGEPVLTLTYGANLIDLEAELDARSQWKAVKATSWDYAGQALFEAEASEASFAEPGNLSGADLAETASPEFFELRHTGQVVTEELQAWADAAMLKSRLSKSRGRLQIKGFPDVKPGVLVKLQGCGERFNGNVYVTGVRHEVHSGTWFSHIQFGLSQEWFAEKVEVAEVPANGMMGPMHGLHVGVAVELADPDGEHRVLVKLPVLDNEARGVWARVATLDAGDNRGSFFRPEIGDEVIVGFLNDDPRDPVILGMAHSSAKPAWHTADDDNHIKGYHSRGSMRLVFDDETNILTIDTPAGNKLVLSEDESSITLEDQHGNLIKMNDAGIEITSIKDIKMEAAANIEIKAGADLKAEGGANVDLKAGAVMKATGSASAEYSSSGATALKGATVQIN